MTGDQNVWKLKTTWNLCFTTSSSTERVYKSNSSHRHPFFSGLTIALLKDLSCLSLSLVFTIDPLLLERTSKTKFYKLPAEETS